MTHPNTTPVGSTYVDELRSGNLPKAKELKILSCIRVLNDASRLRLLHIFLAEQNDEQSVEVLSNKLGMAQPATSHHLATLQEAGITTNRRNGKFIFYSLSKQGIEQLHSLSVVPTDLGILKQPLHNRTSFSGSAGPRDSDWIRTHLRPDVLPIAKERELLQVTKALSDEARLVILYLLSSGERNVTDLITRIGWKPTDQGRLSTSLGVLQTNGIIQSRRDGKCAYKGISRDSSPLQRLYEFSESLSLLLLKPVEALSTQESVYEQWARHVGIDHLTLDTTGKALSDVVGSPQSD